MTTDLMDTLAADLAPVRAHAVERRLGLALLGGAVIAFAGVIIGMGLRPDMPHALGTPMFWIKIAYALALALAGGWAVERLARPVGKLGHRAAWGLLPLVMIALAAVWQTMAASAAARMPLVMGTSAAYCPWLILLTATPMFAALVWAMRGLAPTRLALGGAAVGLTAGAAGAAIYALHCPEAGAPFVAIWYTLGIASAGAVGWLAGPRLLRW